MLSYDFSVIATYDARVYLVWSLLRIFFLLSLYSKFSSVQSILVVATYTTKVTWL